MTTKRKIVLTLIFLTLILMLGSAYQAYYLEERAEFEEAIQAYHLKRHGSLLDPVHLSNYAMLALDRYGPTELFRSEEDYKKLFEEVT